MKESDIINELDSIIAYCDVTRDKAAGLRKKLERFYAPASRKRAGLSDEAIVKLLAKRQKSRYRISKIKTQIA